MQDTLSFTSGQPFICQLLGYVPQAVFQKAVEETKTNHYYKKMKAKEHFVFLLYGVLTRHLLLNLPYKSFQTLCVSKLPPPMRIPF